MKLPKTILFIFFWFLFVNVSCPSEWYVELYSKDNVIVKVPRSKYLEYKELLNVNNYEEGKIQSYYYHIRYNESLFYTELHKQKLIINQ